MSVSEWEQVFRVEQFLFHEARLLDERQWDEWLALWAEDSRYSMPTRFTRLPERGESQRPIAAELSKPDELGWFDEPKLLLKTRVAKLKTGQAWAEEPPSRTRRFISNVEVLPGEAAGEVRVWSNLLLHRSRNENAVETFVGQRQDLLRPSDRSFQIVRRRVVLDSAVLLSPDLELFF